MVLHPVPLSADEVDEYYEGFSNAHPVAALPRRHRQARSTTASGGTRYVEVNRRFAEATAKAAAHGRDGVGPGLPAAAGPEDAAHAAARSDHRLLPAHPVPAGRAVHADAVAHRDRRGPARRRPGRLPPARRRHRTSCYLARRLAGRQHVTRDGRCAVASFGEVQVGFRTVRGGRVPDLDRLRRARRSRRATEAIRQRATRASATNSATRARSCSASTGSTTPRASTSGCDALRRTARRRPRRPRRHGAWCSSPRRAANASRATCRCASDIETAGRSHQRRIRRSRPPGRALPAPPGPPRRPDRVLRRRRRHARHARCATA